MKRTIKIGGSFEGVIATGPFQNMRPGFFVEETLEGDLTDEQIFQRQKELQERSYRNFQEAEHNAAVQRINNERKDFRWRKLPNGKLVPSVTSILSFDKDFDIPPHELSQYASWGTVNHARINHYWKTGVWEKPQNLEGVYADFVIVKRGSLMLDMDCIDFPAYLKKYPFVCKGYGIEVYNEEFEYAGELDYWGIPEESKECKAVPTLADAKRTPDKEHFLQTAAYAKAKPLPGIEWPDKFEQMMLLPLQNKTQQGFSKPLVSGEVDRAFEMFLSKRKKFRQRYGV